MKKIISGIVVRGKQEGRRLGFPTANVELTEKIENGIYAGFVRLGVKEYKAGIFVKDDLLEAHLVGFSGDLYGKEISVENMRKLREIRKFESEEELIEQIKRDVQLISKS